MRRFFICTKASSYKPHATGCFVVVDIAKISSRLFFKTLSNLQLVACGLRPFFFNAPSSLRLAACSLQPF
jgi:hypothetical protein